jgi:hypothetical protein
MKLALPCSLVISLVALSAQTVVVPFTAEGTDSTLNQRFLAERDSSRSKSDKKDIVVFVGDRVIPQFVDGAGWKTTITLINLENNLVAFQVLFFQDNGTDLYVPIAGQGLVRGMNITLGGAGSVTFETTDTLPQLAQGWALISQTTRDTIGGLAIFRQRIPGRTDQEAVVPIVNQFSSHFVQLFDNTEFTTAIALANPTPGAIIIPISIRNENGQIIDQRTIALGAYGHTAFALPAAWSTTAGRRGAIEFLTSGFGVAALGLRFNGPAFTSFHVLENLKWAVPQ